MGGMGCNGLIEYGIYMLELGTVPFPYALLLADFDHFECRTNIIKQIMNLAPFLSVVRFP